MKALALALLLMPLAARAQSYPSCDGMAAGWTTIHCNQIVNGQWTTGGPAPFPAGTTEECEANNPGDAALNSYTCVYMDPSDPPPDPPSVLAAPEIDPSGLAGALTFLVGLTAALKRKP